MENKISNLTRELDLYIKQNYRPEGFKFKDLFDAIGDGSRYATGAPTVGTKLALDFLLKKLELTFTEQLLKLIENKGRKPSEVYTKAGVTKSHFAKIKADKDYHPSKETALAFAIALHLNLDETADLINRAGYTLSHSSESDLIVEFFIERKVYNMEEINNQLYNRGHKPLTNWRKTKDETKDE